jgi:protein-S-isoprenylcysteine O-methyltransferase Ste14
VRLLAAIEPDQLKQAAVAVLVVLGVVFVVVARFVTKIVSKLVLLALLALLAFGIWTQREDLDECQRRVRSGEILTDDNKPCACEVAGFDVTVPSCTPPPGVPQS